MAMCCLVLLLAARAVPAHSPCVITIIDTGIGWQQLAHRALPPGAAVAGMSDPATEHGWAGALTALGACGRSGVVPEYMRPTAIPLLPTVDGRWQLPPACWEKVRSASRTAFAGARPGTLGATLHGQRRVVLVASARQVAQAALVAADEQGMVDCWLPEDGAWADPRLAGAVVFLAPEPGQGIAQADVLAHRFPQTPIFYFCALAGQTRDGTVHDLTPVLLLGRGPGLLASRHTHWHGVVNALDFAPTLLQLAGVRTTGEVAASPLTVTAHADPIGRVRLIAAKARAAYPAVIWLDILYFIVMGLLFFLPVFNLWVRVPIMRSAMIASWLVPLLLVFVLPQCWFLPLGVKIFLMFAGWLLLALPFLRLPPVTAWAWAAALGSAGLLVNVFFARALAPQPYLGYLLVTGFRYYGMGSETMSVLVVLLTMLIGWLLTRTDRRHALIILGIYGVAAIGLGASWWGAKWGGAVTAALAALLFLVIHYRRRLRWWHLPAVLFAAVALGAGLIALLAQLDPYFPNHPGALGREIAAHGLTPLWTMIARKVAFSVRMWHISQGWWALLGGGSFFIGFSLFDRTIGRSGLDARLTPLWEAVYVAWWCAVLAWLVNDNGVEVTGLMWLTMAPGAGMLIYLWRARHAQPAPAPSLSELGFKD